MSSESPSSPFPDFVDPSPDGEPCIAGVGDRPAPAVRLAAAARPILVRMGYEIVDVDRGEGGGRRLRVLVERRSSGAGVSLDECVRLHHILKPLLAAAVEAGSSRDAWTLEVSSPGLARPLIRRRDFLRRLGSRIEVETLVAHGGRDVAHGGRKRFRGVLNAVGENGIGLLPEEGSEASAAFAFDFSAVAAARPCVDEAMIRALLKGEAPDEAGSSPPARTGRAKGRGKGASRRRNARNLQNPRNPRSPERRS